MRNENRRRIFGFSIKNFDGKRNFFWKIVFVLLRRDFVEFSLFDRVRDDSRVSPSFEQSFVIFQRFDGRSIFEVQLADCFFPTTSRTNRIEATNFFSSWIFDRWTKRKFVSNRQIFCWTKIFLTTINSKKFLSTSKSFRLQNGDLAANLRFNSLWCSQHQNFCIVPIQSSRVEFNFRCDHVGFVFSRQLHSSSIRSMVKPLSTDLREKERRSTLLHQRETFLGRTVGVLTEPTTKSDRRVERNQLTTRKKSYFPSVFAQR